LGLVLKIDRILWAGCLILAVWTSPVESQEAGRRVRPPKWSSETESIFYTDAFQQALKGERPGNTAQPSHKVDIAAPPAKGKPTQTWSLVISATTLEDEIKSIKNEIDRILTTPGPFSSTSHRPARLYFGTAAILMKIIDEYDGQVRWKQYAGRMSQSLARTAANAKVGTIQVFREAKQRQADLQDLVLGATPAGENSAQMAEPQGWPDVADRAIMMQRLETGFHDRLQQWISSDAAFSKNVPSAKAESEMMGALAWVLKQDGMPDADDPDYAVLCESLRQAAIELRKAVEGGNRPAAVQSSRNLQTSCDACHEAYR
jgi:hypothetical protein